MENDSAGADFVRIISKQYSMRTNTAKSNAHMISNHECETMLHPAQSPPPKPLGPDRGCRASSNAKPHSRKHRLGIMAPPNDLFLDLFPAITATPDADILPLSSR